MSDGALGSTGGAARVEQPGRIVRQAVDEQRRRRRREPVPPLTGSDHHRLQRSDGADQRLDVAGMVGVGHDNGRAAVVEDVGDLVAVKASVDRHGHETGVPDGEQRLEVLRPVAHQDGDAVTGRQAEFVTQAGGCGGRPGGERAPVGVDALRRRPVPGRRAAGGRGAPPRRRGSSHRPALEGSKVTSQRLPQHETSVALCRMSESVTSPRSTGSMAIQSFNDLPSHQSEITSPLHTQGIITPTPMSTWPPTYPAMRLAEDEARARLATHDHGILCTVQAERGVDAVPVAYVVDEDGYVGVPVDRVKPKSSSRLQRERNLEADPRATLLVEHWDRSDWSRLWWVRAELRHLADAAADAAASRETALAVRLAGRYPQYREQPFVRVLVLRIVGVAGWAAGAG